jgi:hypothetical protein
MKTVVLRIPDDLDADITAESRTRGLSKSHVMRERLRNSKPSASKGLEDIADLIGKVDDDLPADLSSRKKHYLKVMGFGQKRHR